MESSDEEPPDPGRGPSSTARGKQRASDVDLSAGAGTGGGGSGTLRPLMAAGPPPGQVQLPKRRRGVGLVTTNACNECRKKRVKCDGRRPCGRCQVQRDIECVYELPVRQSKEDLRNEIEKLRRRQRCSDTVLDALARSDHWQEVLHRLQSGEPVDSISDWIESGGAAQMPVPLSQYQHQHQHQHPHSHSHHQHQHQPGLAAASYSDPNAANLAAPSMTPYEMPYSPGLPTLGTGLPVPGVPGTPASVQSMGDHQSLHQFQHLTMHQVHPHLQQQPLPNLLQPPLPMQHDSPWDDPYTTSQGASTQSDSHQD